jgi:CheY-like chemotaxis protein
MGRWSVSASSLKVLVVDDNRATRRGLRLLLSLEPEVNEVFEAAGWNEAEKLVYQERPDIVLLDIRMPGMSGMAVARRIKAQLPDVHLVAMSMTADSRQGVLNAGADLFIEKTQLVSDIRAVLNNGISRENGEESNTSGS